MTVVPADQGPHTVSREEFERDPAAVFGLASTGRTVVVLGEDQQPAIVISTPRDKLPMRFD